MNKREKFVKEIAEVINRNSLEGNFNDTPDYILASVAVAAMEAFANRPKYGTIGTVLERQIMTGNIKPFAKAKKQSP